MSIIPRELALVIAKYVDDPRTLIWLLFYHGYRNLIPKWIEECKRNYFRKMIVEGRFTSCGYVVYSTRLVSNDNKLMLREQSMINTEMDTFFSAILTGIQQGQDFTMNCMVNDRGEPHGLYYAKCEPVESYSRVIRKNGQSYKRVGDRYRFYNGRCVSYRADGVIATCRDVDTMNDRIIKIVKEQWSEVLF
jgi:hypothetical protein